MPKRLHLVAIVCILFAACSKDNAGPATPPPNDAVETKPPVQRAITVNINRYIGGYYEALPGLYAATTKKYPLLIFLHGGGQTGDGDKDLPLVLNDGVAKEINQQKFPASFTVDGNNYSFIVLSPQLRAFPPDSMVYSFIDYALKRYRVDSSRIYISGLSMGGVLTTEMAGVYTSLFAAAVPISGESFGSDKASNAEHIASGNLPVWIFHNADDPSIPASTAMDFVDLVNSFHPAIAPKLTIFQAYGHDAWSQALDPFYRENNRNVYEWMLGYKR